MNTLIVTVVAFSAGLVVGMTSFGCPTRAFDQTMQDRRIGEGNWWEFQQQQSRINEHENRLRDQETKRPCP